MLSGVEDAGGNRQSVAEDGGIWRRLFTDVDQRRFIPSMCQNPAPNPRNRPVRRRKGKGVRPSRSLGCSFSRTTFAAWWSTLMLDGRPAAVKRFDTGSYRSSRIEL